MNGLFRQEIKSRNPRAVLEIVPGRSEEKNILCDNKIISIFMKVKNLLTFRFQFCYAEKVGIKPCT
jgi:hypothetical protein